MSQNLQIVQCYSCRTYQTQIAKKTNKWVCKICNEKQSQKKVFGEGSGSDCRINCQRLNSLRANKDKESADSTLKSLESESFSPARLKIQDNQVVSSQAHCSKWTKYLSQPMDDDDDDDDGDNLNAIRASQIFIPKCTPESMEIPCTKKYKNETGEPIPSHRSVFFMGSNEDECFNIDIQNEMTDSLEKNKVKMNILDKGNEESVKNVSFKLENDVKSASNLNFNLIADNFMDEETHLDTVLQNDEKSQKDTKYKNETGESVLSQNSEFLMDSDEDECFNIDIPNEMNCNIEKNEIKINHLDKSNETVINVSTKIKPDAQSKPNMKFNLIAENVISEEMLLSTALPDKTKSQRDAKVNKITDYNMKIKSVKVAKSDKSVIHNSKTSSHGVFKMVSSSNLELEQLKRCVSLLEDIDTYSLDELTEMCNF